MGGDGDYGASQNPAGGYGASQNPTPGYGDAAFGGGSYAASRPANGPYSNPDGGGYGAVSNPEPTPADSSPVPPSGRIFGNGVNMQPSYWNNGDVDLGWPLLKRIAAVKTVRLEIESSAVDVAGRWIYEAVQHGYTVIATYHSFAAINNQPAIEDSTYMLGAIQFWDANYDKLSASGPFIVNIMNEWGHKTIKPQLYADWYNTAITVLRTHYEGPLIIDLPGYGQLAKVAVDAVMGNNGISPINDRNIILSAHIYPQTFNGKTGMTLADLDLMQSTGLPCMIGEFGEDNTTPNTDWRALVSYANNTLGWPVLAWSWDGDGALMNIMTPEFQPFVSGVPNPNYRINAPYAEIVLPFLT